LKVTVTVDDPVVVTKLGTAPLGDRGRRRRGRARSCRVSALTTASME
jgi:hypothetical protein